MNLVRGRCPSIFFFVLLEPRRKAGIDRTEVAAAAIREALRLDLNLNGRIPAAELVLAPLLNPRPR